MFCHDPLMKSNVPVLLDAEYHNLTGSFVSWRLALVVIAALTACTMDKDLMPTSQQIEAVAAQAAVPGQDFARARLEEWATLDLPAAERELMLLDLAQPGTRHPSSSLLHDAARPENFHASLQPARGLQSGGVGHKAMLAKSWP